MRILKKYVEKYSSYLLEAPAKNINITFERSLAILQWAITRARASLAYLPLVESERGK